MKACWLSRPQTGRVTGVYTEPGRSESGRVALPRGARPGQGTPAERVCRPGLCGMWAAGPAPPTLCPPPSAHTVPTAPPRGDDQKGLRTVQASGEDTTESLPAEKPPHRAGPDVNPRTAAERTQRGRVPRGGQGGCPGCCPPERDVGAPTPTRAGPSGGTSPPWLLRLRPTDHAATPLAVENSVLSGGLRRSAMTGLKAGVTHIH